MKSRVGFVALLLLSTLSGWGAQKYAATGLVLRVDRARHALVLSCDAIPGYMNAMVMSFPVRDPKALDLDGLAPGARIEFTVVADKNSYAENIRIKPFESMEVDPAQARRLRILEKMMAQPSSAEHAIPVGQPVPDFTLTDQLRHPVTLSQLSGKVVAVTFIYTRCPFPDYCFRLSSNFGRLQKRFKQRMGRDLVLLSIVIDPANDQPDALANYARIWKADAKGWHFLTGPLPEIQQVAGRFDMNFYPDEALYVHSFHTVVVDRQGKLAANLEGNDFTASQLGDLVQTVLDRAK